MSLSGEVRDNRLHETLQGFRVQEPEHEMRYPYGLEALQLLDHFCAAASDEILLRAEYHLVGIFGGNGCTQVGELDLSRVSAHTRSDFSVQRACERIPPPCRN